MKEYLSSRNKRFIKFVLIHTSCWIVFMCYELSALYYASGELESPKVYICYYALNIGFFYAHAALLTHLAQTAGRRVISGIVLFLCLVALYCLIKVIIGYVLQVQHLPVGPYFRTLKRSVATSMFRMFYFTILSTFYWAATHLANFRTSAAEARARALQAENTKVALESKLAEAQNAYLRQQLNPHLLFNSLNFIYNSVYRESSEGAECVRLLSEIMRFSLEGPGTDGKVQLWEETEQINRLIGINRFRYDKPLALITSFTGIMEHFRIIPLILFTIAENMFKHGNVLDARHPAQVSIHVDENGTLIYRGRNLKRAKSEHASSSRIGLYNVRLRLDYAYPERYTLRVDEDEDFYETTLIIDL